MKEKTSKDFGLTEEAELCVAGVALVLGDDALFRDFVDYKTQGRLLKAFPTTTLKELREWKRERGVSVDN